MFMLLIRYSLNAKSGSLILEIYRSWGTNTPAGMFVYSGVKSFTPNPMLSFVCHSFHSSDVLKLEEAY